MKKKLTLNQAWTLSLRMWRWIAKNWSLEKRTLDLKRQWINKNGFRRNEPLLACFFCEFSVQDDPGRDPICKKCPGRIVDKKFDCTEDQYNYQLQPKKFYKKLLELNRKRKKQVRLKQR